ncbi:15779_t:CDS:2, partial [Dentiscutata heterogama]
HQALNNVKKIVAKSGYHSDKILETDNELADDEKKKRIQHSLDNNHNNHKTDIDDNSTSPVRAFSYASGDSDNYLESGAIVLDTYFVSGSALSSSAPSSSAPDIYSGFGSRSGAIASNTNAASNTNQYAALNTNCYSAPDTNHYAASNANCFDAPKNNHSAAPNTNCSDTNNHSTAPVININAPETICNRSFSSITLNIISYNF